VPRQTEFTVAAPAKINLFLHVGEKRSDGFHELKSLVVFANVGDQLTFTPAKAFSLAVNGPFAGGLEGEGDNLIQRAARAFASITGHKTTAAVTLEKNLPVASGIGGGSADAAAALRGLARLNEAERGPLLAIAATLGSDIPACVLSQPLMMRGRGEQLELLKRFPRLHAVLVNPGVAVPTAKVFAALQKRGGLGNAPMDFDLSNAGALIAYLKTTRNDLEAPAESVAPVIREVLGELARMPGIGFARMSGSGATCFGLFSDQSMAEMAAIALAHSHPDWWIKPTVLGG
jgi:4-diphosphocytidyl-2-C-methyl-D-erythritol kinase